MNAPASARAVKYMRDLAYERDTTAMLAGMPDSWRAWYHTIVNSPLPEYYNWAQADVSKYIDALKKCPVKRAMQDWQEASKTTTPRPEAFNVPLEDGMYRRKSDGTIYKVYHTVNGNNVQVAKRLVVLRGNISDGPVDEIATKAKFVYEGRKPLYNLSPHDRLTMDEARELGALYGTCVICARTLTNELSIHLGIGPVCGQREFGGQFEFLVNSAKLQLGMPVNGPIGELSNAYTEEAILARLDEINQELQ